MTRSFSIETTTQHPAESLFDLSLDIDAHVGSMRRSGETVVAGTAHGRIGLGESVTWRARHFGIWFRLTTKITVLERPRRFVDEQTEGPFRRFRHEHTFRDGPEGGTVMEDRVTLASPVLGFVLERPVLVPYLRRLIEKRNQFLLDALDARAGRD